MKRLIFVAVTSVFIALSSCSKSSSPEPAVCGESFNQEKNFLTSSVVFVEDNAAWTEDNVLTSLNDNERSYTVSLRQEALCTKEQGTAYFEINTSSAPGVSLVSEMIARIEWGEGKSKEAYFCRKENGNLKADYAYETSLPLDVAADYPNGNGSVKAIMTMRFPTLGSRNLDDFYFRSKLKSLNISIAGKHPLP